MRNRITMVLCLLLALLVSACAGGTKESKTAASAQGRIPAVAASEPIHFVADTSPMPDVMSWIAKANDGNADAQFVVSMMYRDDIGVSNILNGVASAEKVDMFREMLRWRHRAEENENALAELSHRPRLERSEDDEFDGDSAAPGASEAIPWLDAAAAHGYPNAEFVLGLAYMNGIHVATDRAKGVELLRHAAVHGQANAQYYLGMMYTMGIDIPADAKRGLQWLDAAADNGSNDALFVLGMMYRDGIGVGVDAAKAEQYHQMAKKYHLWSLVSTPRWIGEYWFICTPNYDRAELGEPESDDCGGDGYYDEYAESLDDEERERYEEEKWLHESQEDQLPYSVDYGLAAKWLNNATHDEKNVYSRILRSQLMESSGCREGNADDLEEIYPDVNLPYALIADAARAGNSDAQVAMAYVDGNKEETALEWLEKAAAQGNENALRTLSEIYHDDHRIAYRFDIEEDWAKSWEYASRMKDNREARWVALQIGDCYKRGVPMCDEEKEEGDEPLWEDARKWYEKNLELGGKSEAIYELGEYYRIVQNDLKTAQKYYLDYIHALDYVTGEMKYAIVYLLDPNHSDDAWFKFADSVFEGGSNGLDSSANDSVVQREKAVYEYIEKLPAIDGLKEETDRQIAFEKDKTKEQLEGFFIYKNVIQPCDAAYWECDNIVRPLYEESISKALAAITAYIQAESGKLDLKRIENTFYLMAIHYGKNDSEHLEWEKNSTIYAIIADSDKLGGDEMAFYTWYLRQIPYACAELYKKLGKQDDWNALLQKATETVANTPEFRNAFGYDLLKRHLDVPKF